MAEYLNDTDKKIQIQLVFLALLLITSGNYINVSMFIEIWNVQSNA